MTRDSIELETNGNSLVKRVICKEMTLSTNSDLMELFRTGGEDGTLLVANKQTGGRGRSGRSWENYGDNSIAMSLLLIPSFGKEYAGSITLLMGLAVRRAILEMTQLSDETRDDLKIKWPNDIVYKGHKICGILTEMAADYGSDGYGLVIGVGINVKESEYCADIYTNPGSVKDVLGFEVSREKLIGLVLYFFAGLYRDYEENLNVGCVMAEYEDSLSGFGKRVKVLDPSGEYEGLLEGIDEMGQLLVRRDDGTVNKVYSGEVSIRGLYGYV